MIAWGATANGRTIEEVALELRNGQVAVTARTIDVKRHERPHRHPLIVDVRFVDPGHHQHAGKRSRARCWAPKTGADLRGLSGSVVGASP